VNATAAAVVGREAELDAIDAFLADRSALPAALVMDGPAGAGKSTLWQAAVERAGAAGFTVLACRPAGAEAQLSYAGLTDLLEPHLDRVLPGLPLPQRHALEVALLLDADDAAAPDERAISAGMLSALRALAQERPVLIAIDDAQWLDPASAGVVAFALRRLRDAPVGAITAWRISSPSVQAASPPPNRAAIDRAFDRPATRIDVGPMSLGALNRLLRSRTTLEFNRRTLQRIHETSGGNPFYALELASAMARAQGATTSTDEPLPLSAGLNDLLAVRLEGLDGETRDALFVAAAAAQPTIGLVEAALGAPATARLRPAVDANVIRIDGDAIEFVHPLLAAAAYAAASAGSRRRWHARLAEVAPDQETRARHLAFARPETDAEVARALAEAARHAMQRGAPGTAAELYGSALERMPEIDVDGDGASAGTPVERATLVAEAAPVLANAGSPDRAQRLLEASIAAIPASPLRAELLLQLADIAGDGPGGGELQTRLIDQALSEAAGDLRRTALALLDREQTERGRDRLAAALPIARQALDVAEASGDEALLAEAHVRTADLETVLGLVDDPVRRFERAIELGKRHRVDAENSARSMLAVCLIRRGRVDEARPYLLPELARAIAEGDEGSESWVCMYLAELEWLAGRWDEAGAYAAEGEEAAERAGLRMRLGPLRGLVALVEASRGDPDRARALGTDAAAILEEVDETAYGNYVRGMVGFFELSVGNAAAAHDWLNTYGLERGIEGSKRLSFIGDEIEALVRLGRLEEAAKLTDELARRGEATQRPTLAATAARSRGLVLGAQGDLPGAIAAAEEAVAAYERLGLPFELARACLVLGEVQRRAKQRKAARETLDLAIEGFERLGAHLWVDRARAEQGRIGGRTSIEGLSETELRVAQLVAEGRSNKEVAAELFVSVRAVEANLSRVYAKLGIESRTELARRI